MHAAPLRSKYLSWPGATLGKDAGALLAVMDRRLNFVLWTPEAERLTSFAACQALGRSLYEVFPEAPGSPAEAQYFKVLRTGKPATIVTQLDDTCWQVTARKQNEDVLLFARRLCGCVADGASSSGTLGRSYGFELD